jgi:hypothetical protein
MLTNRPTVARTSVWLIWLAASKPTRAREPRTEITRPKDAVATAIDMSEIRVAAPLFCPTMDGVIGETVKPRDFEDGQNRDIFGPRFGSQQSQGRFCRSLIEKWAFRAAWRYQNRAGA